MVTTLLQSKTVQISGHDFLKSSVEFALLFNLGKYNKI